MHTFHDSNAHIFPQVDREFIEDNFNLYGLRAMVPHYNEALDMILDIERMDEAFSDDRQVCQFCLMPEDRREKAVFARRRSNHQCGTHE